MSESRKNYFFWNEAVFEGAVKKRVCPRCRHFDENGACHAPDSKGCALLRYLPQLVIIAQHLEKPTLASFSCAVREGVVMDCANPDPAATCPLCDTLDCGLEEYLPFVLQAVTETDRALEERPEFKEA